MEMQSIKTPASSTYRSFNWWYTELETAYQ